METLQTQGLPRMRDALPVRTRRLPALSGETGFLKTRIREIAWSLAGLGDGAALAAAMAAEREAEGRGSPFECASAALRRRRAKAPGRKANYVLFPARNRLTGLSPRR